MESIAFKDAPGHYELPKLLSPVVGPSPDVVGPSPEAEGRGSRQTRGRGGALLTGLVFCAMLPLFCWAAWRKAEVGNSGIAKNSEHAMFDYDQHSYLNMGRLLREEGYRRVVPRHRMPGFPYLLSLLYAEADAYPVDPTGKDPRGVSEGYFARAKVFSIALGCVSLLALYGLCRCFLPAPESHLVTWGFGWLVAAIRVPYVQPETVFYVLLLISLVLLWQLLARPRWWMAPLAVLALSGAYILKSSVIPLLALFIACAAARAGWRVWSWLRGGPRDRRALAGAGREFGLALLVPLGFAALLLPYFRNTAALHGSPLWDAHSRHYLWMDTNEEKRYWRNAGISNPGFTPPEGRVLPTAASYFREHSLSQMWGRLAKGRADIVTMIKSRYRGAYDLAKKWCLPVLLVLAAVSRRRVWAALQARPMEWLLIGGFFAGYAVIYCWYQAIGVGPRLFLALFLPFLFFSMLGIGRLAEGKRLPFRGRQIAVRPLLNAMMLAVIAVQAIQLMSGPYWTVEGGR